MVDEWADLPADTPESDDARITPLAAVGRVLVLPRSTFVRVADEGVACWPAALGFIAIAATAKSGVAMALALRGATAVAPLKAVAYRYSLAIVAPLLFAAAFACFVLLAQSLWRGEASYSRLLSAASLALAPLIVRDLTQALYMAATRRVLLDPGLSALVAPPSHSAFHRGVYSLLGRVDLFTIWAFVLLTLAVSVTPSRTWWRQTLVVSLFAAVAAVLSAAAMFVALPLIGR